MHGKRWRKQQQGPTRTTTGSGQARLLSRQAGLFRHAPYHIRSTATSERVSGGIPTAHQMLKHVRAKRASELAAHFVVYSPAHSRAENLHAEKPDFDIGANLEIFRQREAKALCRQIPHTSLLPFSQANLDLAQLVYLGSLCSAKLWEMWITRGRQLRLIFRRGLKFGSFCALAPLTLHRSKERTLCFDELNHVRAQCWWLVSDAGGVAPSSGLQHSQVPSLQHSIAWATCGMPADRANAPNAVNILVIFNLLRHSTLSSGPFLPISRA